jgi:hypothetical protein
MSLASLDAVRTAARSNGLPELFELEAEYEAAMQTAELAFTEDLARRISDGTLSGVDMWRTLHATAVRDGRVDPDAIAEAVAALEASVASEAPGG